MAAKNSKQRPLCRCIECKHARCVRWGRNPVISICQVRTSFGEPYRMVANTTHHCESFLRFDGVVKYIDQMN